MYHGVPDVAALLGGRCSYEVRHTVDETIAYNMMHEKLPFKERTATKLASSFFEGRMQQRLSSSDARPFVGVFSDVLQMISAIASLLMSALSRLSFGS